MALPDDRYGEDTAKPVIAGVFGTSGLSLGGEGLYGTRLAPARLTRDPRGTRSVAARYSCRGMAER